MNFREATQQDIEQIALLHTRSWQENYQGILLDEYLNNEVKQDRLKVWKERLEHPKENQYILVAEENGFICGLACVFASHDPVWGSLLDNLHILSTYKGKGLGRKLLRSAAAWAYEQDATQPFYLWVYTRNVSARKFYQLMGGVHEETTEVENPGGGYGEVHRIVWRDIPALLSSQ
ncbi:GNAT family N-acetyltransferase [Rhodocytophaga rosea]|uniref:GNAT family N-acetyltransferase n=1 Tax=Rhodocytophaga rosea TaxID=2704465 RepID=A0A6C0GUN8_9BACT|nr:GNAT family N-acetyltransferase [Rhodocytophaga rosea]QHT71050.1 GNAT family N-acetyltransferase [Rhodocytophaga rosea]